MAVNSINRKALDRAKKNKAKKFKEQLKRFNEKPSSKEQEQEKNESILDFYSNLSPEQKKAFNKELEK